jgi:superfamily II DNA or RNA helicase
MIRFERHKLPVGRREQVFARAPGSKCQRCGTHILLETFHVSHLIPVAGGGTNDVDNLQAWCRRCNLSNGSKVAADPRVEPRDWQLRGLDPIVNRTGTSGVATLQAAPGAGKTMFSGYVFEALREVGLVDRMVVVVPRVPLLEQWEVALRIGRQLQLKPQSAIERPGQVGTIVTYQSLLNGNQLDAHRQMAMRSRTLLVLDEVHHLGERDGTHAAWARSIGELAGSIDDLRVAGVLNLSGTLWRSTPTERISTVRYRTLDENHLVSEADFTVDTEELVRTGLLRPIDLYRLDSKVRLADYRTVQDIQGHLSDLNEEQTRASIRLLGSVADWRSAFVSAILDRLEVAHRALQGYPAKALIVASQQSYARAFHQEVNRQMEQRGLRAIAELAVSEEQDAPAVLKRFRTQSRLGVLCTVDMAGEGYDCPEIAVLGYASNKLTPMYVRQVIARAMRVTKKEQELGYVIPAQVVLPDAQELVEVLVGYLAKYTNEVLVPESETLTVAKSDGRRTEQLDIFSLPSVRYDLQEAALSREVFTVPYADGSKEDIDARLNRRFEAELENVGLPAAFAPRFLAASRRTVGDLLAERPFDRLVGDAAVLEALTKGQEAIHNAEPHNGGPVRSDISEETRAQRYQDQLTTLSGWWAKKGDPSVPVKQFQTDINKASGIASGGRSSASVAQLKKAVDYAKERVFAHARKTGQTFPRI